MSSSFNMYDCIGICCMFLTLLAITCIYMFYCYPKDLERRKQRDNEYNQWREKLYQVLNTINFNLHDIRVDIDAIDHNVSNISYKYPESKE